MSKTCESCAKPVSRSSKGLCRLCALAITRNNPEVQAKRLERLRAALRTPEARQAKSAARVKLEQERANDPVWIEYKRQCGLRVRALYDASPEGQAKNLAKRAEAGRKSRERWLGWCPVDRREEYEQLRRKIGAGAAREAIEAEIPGTMAHAQRMIASTELAMRVKAANVARQEY